MCFEWRKRYSYKRFKCNFRCDILRCYQQFNDVHSSFLATEHLCSIEKKHTYYFPNQHMDYRCITLSVFVVVYVLLKTSVTLQIKIS